MSEQEIRLCKDCACLIGRRNMPEFAAAWKCGAQENVAGTKIDVVTGEKRNLYIYHDCAATRDEVLGCGLEGKWFKKYEAPSPLDFPSVASINKQMDDIIANLGGTT